jgi:hypothetical protein
MSRGVLRSTGPFRLSGYRFAEFIDLLQLQQVRKRSREWELGHGSTQPFALFFLQYLEGRGHHVQTYTSPDTRHRHQYFKTSEAPHLASPNHCTPDLLHVSYTHTSPLTQISAPPDTADRSADHLEFSDEELGEEERTTKDLFVTRDGVAVAWGQTEAEEHAWLSVVSALYYFLAVYWREFDVQL